jgi:hypothetical protein
MDQNRKCFERNVKKFQTLILVDKQKNLCSVVNNNVICPQSFLNAVFVEPELSLKDTIIDLC